LASGDFLDLSERAARMARFDTDVTYDMLRAKEAVNTAYLQSLATGVNYGFLQQEGTWTTTAGSDVYTYADIASAIGITGASIAEIMWLTNDSEGSVLESSSWIDLERKALSSQDDDPDGEPVYWAKWASRIRLYPNPDEGYTLGTFMRLAPAEMTADGDTPVIPFEHRAPVIVSGAAAYLLRMEGGMEAHQEAQFHQRQFDDAVQTMRTAHGTAIPGKPDFNLKGAGWDHDFPDGTRTHFNW
jgi:hypothetical protein